MDNIELPGPHNYLLVDKVIAKNEQKTLFVIIITFITMIAEVIGGYLFGSMALLADGWHMAGHAGALMISFMVYRVAKNPKLTQHFSFGTGKFIPLGGYTSGIFLAIVAVFMIYQSVERLFSPELIKYDEAIITTVIGLLVNILCVWILFDKENGGGHDHHPHHHHDHDHKHHENKKHQHVHDHNMKGAITHVFTDTLTSVFALFALTCGKYLNLNWADPVIGIIGGIVILFWAKGLIKNTTWELLDGKAKAIDHHSLVATLEEHGIKVIDLHIWRIAPSAIACELLVQNDQLHGGEYYKKLLTKFKIEHLIIEERVPN